MSLLQIKKELNNLKTSKHKDFSSSLIPGSKEIIGVKIPDLRILAKQIAKTDPITFLETNDFSSFELEMLQAMVIGYMKKDIETVILYAKKFIPLIHDWAVNDCFCQTLKIASKKQEDIWELINCYLDSKSEFELRVIVVLMMTYFLNDQYIDQVIKIVDTLKHDGYYYQMGAAWLIATMMAKYPEKTLKYLSNNNLDDFVHNKAIQKIKESFRVNDELKKQAEILKRKKVK